MAEYTIFWNYKEKQNGNVVIKREELQRMIDAAYESGYLKGLFESKEKVSEVNVPIIMPAPIPPTNPLEPALPRNPLTPPYEIYCKDTTGNPPGQFSGVVSSQPGESVTQIKLPTDRTLPVSSWNTATATPTGQITEAIDSQYGTENVETSCPVRVTDFNKSNEELQKEDANDWKQK